MACLETFTEKEMGSLYRTFSELGEDGYLSGIIKKLEKKGIEDTEAERMVSCLVKEEWLALYFEISCPNCGADVKFIETREEIPSGPLFCKICGRNFPPTSRDLFPRYKLTHKGKTNLKQFESISEKTSAKKKDQIVKENVPDFFKNHPGIISIAYDQLYPSPHEFPTKEYKELLNRVETLQDPNKKGKALEELIVLLLRAIPGLLIEDDDIRVKLEHEEIDIFVTVSDPFLSGFLANYFIVECKNWSNKVEKNEILSFREKILERSLRCGLMVAYKGFTSGLKRKVEEAREEECYIMLMHGKELTLPLKESWDGRHYLLKKHKEVVKGSLSI